MTPRSRRLSPLSVIPVVGMPEVRAGDDLPALLLSALASCGLDLIDGDVLVVSAKVVSKAAGLRAPADQRAALVLQHARRVVAERSTTVGIARVVESLAGPVLAGAGIDGSNTGDPRPSDGGPSAAETVLLLPEDPDAEATALRKALCAAARLRRLGVVLADTSGRPWRVGQTDYAVGSAGLVSFDDLRGQRDADGRLLEVTATAIADELAAAANLIRPKAQGVAAALVRGLGGPLVPPAAKLNPDPGAKALLRAGTEDWFSLGAVEAVRSALGLAPGTPEAVEVGIPSVHPEEAAERIARACRLARLQDPITGIPADHPRANRAAASVDFASIRTDIVQEGVHVEAPDQFTLGLFVSRLLVALAAESLPARLASHSATPTTGAATALVVLL